MRSNSCLRLTDRGFTLVELLVVIAIIGVLVALLSRCASSSRVSAADAVRQQPKTNWFGASQLRIVPQVFPPGVLGWDFGTGTLASGPNRLIVSAGCSACCLFLEQGPLYNQISPYFVGTTPSWLWPGVTTTIPTLTCRSDSANPKINGFSPPVGFQGNYQPIAGSTNLQCQRWIGPGRHVLRNRASGWPRYRRDLEPDHGERDHPPEGPQHALGLNQNDWRGAYWDNYGGTCYISTQFPPNTDQPDALLSCVSTKHTPSSPLPIATIPIRSATASFIAASSIQMAPWASLAEMAASAS